MQQGREEPPDLGPCCICGRDDATVRNVLTLPYRAPALGTGWGCAQCGLPSNGALAVVCDACAEKLHSGDSGKRLRWVIDGYPAEKRRLAFEELPKVPFTHDLSQHPEVPQA